MTNERTCASCEGDACAPDGSGAAAPRFTAAFYAVSVGPGDPELLTLKAARTLEAADTVAYVQTKRGATVAYDIARGACDLSGKRTLALPFAMSSDPDVLARAHRQAADAVVSELSAGRSVAMPVLGDASIYASTSYLKDLVAEAGYAVVTVPGVPSFCAVAARLGQNLTPQMSAPLHVVPAGYDGVEEALDLPGTKVIMKAGKPFEELKALLRARGELDRASAVQNCGMENEVVARSLDDAQGAGPYYTTVIVRP